MAQRGHERDGYGTASTADDLDYMHARFANPGTGRFLSVDPRAGSLTSPQSLNRFGYVRGNPIAAIDPMGACTVSTVAWNGPGDGQSMGCDDEIGVVGGFGGWTIAGVGGGYTGGNPLRFKRELGPEIREEWIPKEPPPEEPGPDEPCGVNPVTGSFGFQEAPVGEVGHMSSPWGAFQSPRPGRAPHGALDIAGLLHTTPVMAFRGGTVIQAGPNDRAPMSGVSVIIDHGDVNGDRVVSSYSHLMEGSVPVSVGDNVVMGQTIAIVGNTGNAAGQPTHVHFVVRVNGVKVDPDKVLNGPCKPK